MRKVALTPASIDALQKGLVADPLTPGLAIEMLASGKKRWRQPDDRANARRPRFKLEEMRPRLASRALWQKAPTPRGNTSSHYQVHGKVHRLHPRYDAQLCVALRHRGERLIGALWAIHLPSPRFPARQKRMSVLSAGYRA